MQRDVSDLVQKEGSALRLLEKAGGKSGNYLAEE